MVKAAPRHVETSVRAAIDLVGSVSWVVFRDGRDSAVMNHETFCNNKFDQVTNMRLFSDFLFFIIMTNV